MTDMHSADNLPGPVTPRPGRPPSMLRALERVLSPSGFPYGSNFDLFRDAEFGRDSLEVAEDLILIRPDIARVVIRRLAVLQGTALDIRTEEEPGKIHHEHRAVVMDGQSIGDRSLALFQHLARNFGLASTEEELRELAYWTHYGTVDATPLYVRLVARYCAAFGPGILRDEYTPVHGAEGERRLAIADSVRRAVDWITSKIERSDLGLLEWQRMTPHGHLFQAWKDGGTSYLHTDGSYANYDAPMASIEVQGLAYDALTVAAQFLNDAPSEDRARWAALAERLQRTTLDRFWMPEERYFAMAIDRDPRSGEARQVRVLSSNPGSLLDSGIFDTLDPQERRRCVTAIVEHVHSSQFLTPVGVRCNSVIHRDLQDYAGYQSSYTVWHKETYDIAKGFRRQGFPRLAQDLENRLLNAVNIAGGATEFLYVMPDNRVDYAPLDLTNRPEAEVISGTNVPENDQAWSIAAALAIKWRRGHEQDGQSAPEGWQRDLEARLLDRVPFTPVLRTIREVQQALPSGYSFRVDRGKGWESETAFTRRRDLPARQ